MNDIRQRLRIDPVQNETDRAFWEYLCMYHLTAQQISMMSIDVDENSAYVLLDGTLCYRCWIFLESELTGEKTGQDGTYTVYMNLETGVVEDIQFLSEHGGGNG